MADNLDVQQHKTGVQKCFLYILWCHMHAQSRPQLCQAPPVTQQHLCAHLRSKSRK